MKIIVTLSLCLFVLLGCFAPFVMAAEIDAITSVDHVIDGDTFDTTTEGRIRLADIDAPEYYELGYDIARDFLLSLIDGKTLYLDIDDKYRTDPYERLVCVVYIKYNSTHYKNINKALLNGGVAEISNYDNEFNPYTWTLYVHEDIIPEFSPPLILPLLMVSTFLMVIFYRRKQTC